MFLTLTDRIKQKIETSGDEVFVRSDFNRLGGYDQVGRVLRNLVDDNYLLRPGYGVFARGKTSVISGNPVPRIPLQEVARLALEKLGIESSPSRAASAYNEGRSTQIPVTEKLNVGNSRICRRISFGGRTVAYERG